MKKSNEQQPPGRTASLKRAQERDPKTGRPLIETTLAYDEPIPPPPPQKKPSLNKPLPWKAIAKKNHDEDKKLYQVMSNAVNGSNVQPSVNAPPAPAVATNEALLKQLPVGAVENRPYCMGSIRLVKEEQPAPFSREIPLESLMKKRVPGFGSNAMPSDGRRQPVRDETLASDTNPITFQKKPPAQQTQAHPKEDPKTDIFGKAPPTRPPAPSLTLELTTKPGQHTITGGTFDHLMFAPKRTLLVEATRALASNRAAAEHIDPAAPTDIFGQPQKCSPSKNVFRQSMFPGDTKPIQIFGESTATLEPKAVQLQKMVSSFPTYIANPPDHMQHEVRDLVTSKHKPRQLLQSQQPSEALLVVPSSKADTSFYTSSLYLRFLVACGVWGVRRFRHILRSLDKDGDAVLSRFECKTAFVKLGLELDDVELSEMMLLAPVTLPNGATASTAETKKNATPSNTNTAAAAAATPSLPQQAFIPRLMEVLRKGDLSVKRRQVAIQCFTSICKMAHKSSFNMTLDDVVNTTDFAEHPRFEPHVKGGMREIMNGFVASWGTQKQRTSVVSEDEFVEFYHDFAPLIASDKDFERYLRAMHGLKNAK